MAPLPLSRLEFVATSVAEELGIIALADLAAASPGEDARVIGGHMVSLHALRWQLELPRETLDADLGVTPEIVQTPDLIDRLLRLGYERLGGNRFGRRIEGLPAIEGGTPQAIKGRSFVATGPTVDDLNAYHGARGVRPPLHEGSQQTPGQA